MKKVVIISIPRTGSSILIQNLNSHPKVKFYGEIFHPSVEEHLDNKALLGTSLDERYNNPMRFIEKIISNNKEKSVVGFKIFEGHNNTVLDSLLKDPTFFKVLLYRENYLANYSSLLIAHQSKLWNNDLPCDTQEKVYFDYQQFEKFYRYYEECFMNWKAVIRDNWSQQYLEIFYNPNDSMLESSKKIMHSLGLDPDIIRIGKFIKLNSSNLIQRFQNPKEVSEYLSKIGKEHWIQE